MHNTSQSMASEWPTQKQSKSKAERFVDLGATIAGAAPEGDEIVYWHSTLCQVGLPRSQVNDNKFERRSGKATLLIEAGQLFDGEKFVLQSIPYGAMPRLLLAWMNQHAVRFKTCEIPLGDSANSCIRTLGKVPNGGRNSVHSTFKKQLKALAACRMTLGFKSGDVAHTYPWQPIQHFEAWMVSDNNQKSGWPKSITFSEAYISTLRDHAVPIDFRAYMELSYSSLAMDVYSWLAQRLHRIKAGQPEFMSWKNLQNQFGQEYTGEDGPRNFKRKFLQVLQPVLVAYPKAQVERSSGGLELRASRPPVLPRNT